MEAPTPWGVVEVVAGTGMLLSAIVWCILLAPEGLPPIKADDYHDSVAVRRTVARLVLTWPLWGWFTVPLAVIGCIVWIGWGTAHAAASLWRAAFPGSPPSDWDGPSQGGGYR